MKELEAPVNLSIPPDQYIIVRLDGQGFTKLADKLGLERPFDSRLRDLMSDTMMFLVSESGFKVLYGYTQSDEISLLISKNDDTFSRRVQKITSILAGKATAYFLSTLINEHEEIVTNHLPNFDCRVIPVTDNQTVVDYFRWRAEDASRNCLNTYSYWTLRQAGHSARVATKMLSKKTVDEKIALLAGLGVDYSSVPIWQTRGLGSRWIVLPTKAENPRTGQEIEVKRRGVFLDFKLPVREEYSQYILDRINDE